jgi:hypothetical protein
MDCDAHRYRFGIVTCCDSSVQPHTKFGHPSQILAPPLAVFLCLPLAKLRSWPDEVAVLNGLF